MAILSTKGQIDSDDNYVLPRNNSERDRLQAQHELFTDLLGGRLIVDRTVMLKPGDRVLDSGTGAASWILHLREVAAEGVKFVGVDISAHMFPASVPSNVELFEMSSLKLPSEWGNTFDIVNQRLLIAAFTIEQWKMNLSELLRVLKPGGVVQLTEIDQFGSLDESNPLPATNRAVEFLIAVRRKRRLLDRERMHQLSAFTEEAGFSDIRVEVYKAPLGRQWGEIGNRCTRNWISVIRTFGSICLAEGGLGVCSSQGEIDGVLERAAKEWDDIPGVFVQLFTIIAKKPL